MSNAMVELISRMQDEIAELRRDLEKEVLVLRTALGAVLPLLPAEAALELDKALRKLWDDEMAEPEPSTTVMMAVLRLPNGLLPVAKPEALQAVLAARPKK